MAESVKAKVIALAEADPFLTIEELSELADTTPRYVRTILSEAGLSLNRLRRQYARRLERRLGKQKQSQTLIPCEELEVLKITGAEVHSSLVAWSAQEKLFQINAVDRKAEITSYVQLVTPCRVTMCSDYTNLRELLPYGPGELAVGKQKIEIIKGEDSLNFLLDLGRTEHLLKLSSVLSARGEIVALERRWFGLEGVVLSWSKLEPELKVHLTG